MTQRYHSQTGGCIIIANHPTGLADGLAVFEAIRERRPDHLFLANADALRVIPKCEDIIIPVEWVKSKRTHSKARNTLLAVKLALQDERCVVIFPSGALATLGWRGLKDARNSGLYYLFEKLNAELRDITLFHELLNKKEKVFRMTFGNVIPPDKVSKNAEEATAEIRKIIEQL